MKLLLSILILGTCGGVSAKDCQVYHLTAYASKNGLVVAKGSLSERKFDVHQMASLKLLPYLDKTVEGDFVVADERLVLDASGLRYSVRDPLNPVNEIRKLNVTECPVYKVPKSASVSL